MIGTIVSIAGILLTLLGTFVRAVPDVDRRARRRFYCISPFTRELFSKRMDVKRSARGYRHPIEHPRVRREVIDYIDAHDTAEPPDQIPKMVKNGAARIEIELPNGEVEYYLQGGDSKRTLVELLTQSIERACRNWGLAIAIIGALIAILGAAM